LPWDVQEERGAAVPLLVALLAALVAGGLTVVGLHPVHRFGRKAPHADEIAQRTGLWALVRRRVGPMEVSGLALTVAGIGLGVAVAAFGFAAIEATRTTLWWVDASLADWGSGAATSWSTTGLEVLTRFGSTVVVVIVAVVAGLADARRRRRPDGLIFLLLVVLGQNLLANAIKLVVGRERPPVPALTAESGFSFPSGHTAAATATFVALALLLGRGRSRPARLALTGAAAAVATAVAASRVLLGVHWVSDVIGGAAVGLIWVGAVTLVFGGHRLVHAAELPDPATVDRAGSRVTPPGHRRPAGGTMSETGPERGPTADQVNARAAELAAEPERGEDPRRQAEALLEESEARVEDPAARIPGDGDVIRRGSDEGVEPH
jgi:membrane-associated phospholipid phosphatase